MKNAKTKLKNKSAAKKRFHVTGSGKIQRKGAGKRHLLEWQRSNTKRALGKKVLIDKTDEGRVIAMLPKR